MSGRTVLAGALACLLLASCAGADDPAGSESTPAPKGDVGREFSAEVQELCTPVYEKTMKLGKAIGKQRRFAKAAAATTRAERKLAEGLLEVEPPPASEGALDKYVETLEEYSDAQRATTEGRGSAARRFDDIVHAAKLGVRLFEASERLGLPSVCPPIADTSTTLFVAKANRDCFEARKGLERSQVPESRAEALELLDTAGEATRDVARALERSLPPRASLRVRRIVTLGKERVRTLEGVRDAVAAGDLAAFEEAWPDLVTARRRLARQTLTVGLVSCAKLFGLLGI